MWGRGGRGEGGFVCSFEEFVGILGDRYKEFLAVVMETPGETEQVTRLRGLVFHLPMAHYHTLRYLTRHLNRVADNSDQNKVPPTDWDTLWDTVLAADPVQIFLNDLLFYKLAGSEKCLRLYSLLVLSVCHPLSFSPLSLRWCSAMWQWCLDQH